jgi:transcriptional regulator with XRE-family HTH domain
MAEDQMKEDIGKRIREARESKGLKSGELATLCGWEDTKSRISNYEKGISSPSYSDMVKIARVLDINAAYLAFGDTSVSGGADVNSKEGSLTDGEQAQYDTVKTLGLPIVSSVEDLDEYKLSGDRSLSLPLSYAITGSVLSASGVSASKALITKQTGTGLLPLVPDGTPIGVDTGSTYVVDGDLYLLMHADMLRVAFVYRIPGGYRLKFTNEQDWPIETITGDAAKEIRVIGRVFWYSVMR